MEWSWNDIKMEMEWKIFELIRRGNLEWKWSGNGKETEWKIYEENCR